MLEHLISTASCQDAALARMRAPWQRMILPLASCSYSPYLQCGMALCPTRKPAERTHTRLLPACLPPPTSQDNVIPSPSSDHHTGPIELRMDPGLRVKNRSQTCMIKQQPGLSVRGKNVKRRKRD